MNERAVVLENKVRELYEQKNPDRDSWTDWLYENHVFVVADYAAELARRFEANAEYARAAAMLHDIADVKMKRPSEDHEQESLSLARQLLSETGYRQEEMVLIADDVLRFHSCHGEERPSSPEGKVLATADALAHLKTDFYIFAAWGFGLVNREFGDYKSWALKKLERDYRIKILFDEVRAETAENYESLKKLLSV